MDFRFLYFFPIYLKDKQMNYELLYKLTIEEIEKLRGDVFLLKKRNEILRNENERLETIIKNTEEEKNNLKKDIEDIKEALNFKKDE